MSKAITFCTEGNKCFLIYNPSPNTDRYWLFEKLEKNGYFPLKKIFYFKKEHLYNKDDFKEEELADTVNYQFHFGDTVDDYIKINKEILDIKNNLYFYKEEKLEEKFFIAEKTSLYSKN